MVLILLLSACISLSVQAQVNPVGETDFDKNFSDVQKQSNFSALVKTFESEAESQRVNSNNSVSNQIRVGFSRSLQAPAVDLENPRSLLAIKLSQNNPPTFIGYSPKMKQLEVISWNPRELKYEFKIVENYGPGLKPVVKSADRDTCIKCHQNEGPIFSHFPWSETDFNPKISQKMNQENRGGEGFGFDDKVRKSNQSLQRARICKELCKSDDIECRKRLLFGSLLNASENESTVAFNNSDQLFEIDKEIVSPIEKALHGRNFSIASSVIPDRLIDLEHPESSKTILAHMKKSESKPVKGQFNSSVFFSPEERFFETKENFEASKGFFDYIDGRSTQSVANTAGFSTVSFSGTNINEPSSPAFKRPNINAKDAKAIANDLKNIGSSCIKIPKEVREAVEGLSADLVKRLAISSSQSTAWMTGKLSDTAYATFLVKQSKYLEQGLKNACNFGINPGVDEITKLLTKNKKQMIESDQLSISDREKVKGHFSASCTECHNSNNIDLGLKWDNLEEISKYRGGDGKTLIERLKLHEMPPKDAKKGLTDEEREAMINALQKVSRAN